MKQLFLASQSKSRAELLKSMDLKFAVIDQSADETITDKSLSIEESVRLIATRKMDNIILPYLPTCDAFVITADTLVQDKFGVIHGKPKNRDDAIAKIQALRGQSQIATAFCVEKFKINNSAVISIERIISSVVSSCVFEIPDNWIDKYLAHVDATTLAGAIAIEGYGLQFLKSITGSFSGILGLPLFELRQALEKLEFYS